MADGREVPNRDLLDRIAEDFTMDRDVATGTIRDVNSKWPQGDAANWLRSLRSRLCRLMSD